ncbi:MAG: BLUF domain-containing protein [Ginsengibacter sp.]
MNYLIYVSSATQHFSDEDLKALLIISRQNNINLGITGLLLYSESNFIQVIEGEAEAIDGLYSKIKRDPRHTGFLRLLKGEISERNFPEWSMAFKKISNEDYSMIAGYESLKGTSSQSLDALGKQPVLMLLKNFLKINSEEARYSV